MSGANRRMTFPARTQGDRIMSKLLARGLAAAAVLALVAAGCGDDDDADTGSADESGSASETADADVTAYCDAVLAIETAPEPDIDFETMSPEEQAEAAKTYATETLKPLVDEAVAVAPDELATDVEAASAAVDEVATTGDFEALDGPEASAVFDRIHAFDVENCDWNTQDVTAVNYAFEGLPDELPAGVTNFEFSNDAEELHELILVRKNDGVTETAQELLALPEEEAMSKVTDVASAFAPPGQNEYTVADLEPGEYIALCFIPTGMTSEEAPPPEGAMPHAMQGMVAEFTVS